MITYNYFSIKIKPCSVSLYIRSKYTINATITYRYKFDKTLKKSNVVMFLKGKCSLTNLGSTTQTYVDNLLNY